MGLTDDSYPRRRRTLFLPDWLFGVLFFFHGFEVTKRSIAKQSLEPGQAFKNYFEILGSFSVSFANMFDVSGIELGGEG